MTTTPSYPPPLAQIEEEARKAAATYDDVNSACPYSFYTEQGRAYKRAFQKAKLAHLTVPGKVKGGAS